MVASIVLVFGIVNGVLFLEETHEVHKQKRDPGVELGKKILIALNLEKPAEDRNDGTQPGETDRLLGAQSTTYDSETPTLISGQSSDSESNHDLSKEPPAVTTAFTRPVVALIISYGILAYHTMGFEQLMPVFLSTPVSETPPSNMFRFHGGLGMTTQAIGFILSMQGIFSMVTQFFVFPPLARYFGTLNLYRFCMATYVFSYLMVPYLDFLPPYLQLPGIYCILAIKIIYGVLAYPSNAILLTNSAPSLLVLGTINGIAASCASLARAISPTVTGMIYSIGLDIDMVGLAWWVNGAVCILGAIQCLGLHDSDFEGFDNVEESDDQGSVTETAAVEAQLALAVPTASAEEVINEYGLVRASVEGEIAVHAVGSYMSTRSFPRPLSSSHRPDA